MQIKVRGENLLMVVVEDLLLEVGSFFYQKAVLHFDYLVFLKAIQLGLFHSGLFSWD